MTKISTAQILLVLQIATLPVQRGVRMLRGVRRVRSDARLLSRMPDRDLADLGLIRRDERDRYFRP